MKILLINSRYKYIGGPERYLFNLKDLLESKGHEVIPFSIKNKGNVASKYEDYFASPLTSNESVLFKDQPKDIPSIYKTLQRNFYSSEVESKLSRLIEDTKPDFAFVILYLRKLSPAVLVALTNMKIPFAVRLSDFSMICPSSNFFRHESICELCKNGNEINSIRYRCVHGSFSASLVNYAATRYHRSKGIFGLVSHFISPSLFLIEKMIEAGWDRNKFHHVPTFAMIPPAGSSGTRNRNQIVYAGRLEFIKGVHLLLEAVKILKREYTLPAFSVKLAGSGDDAYTQRLTEYCKENDLTEITFMGALSKNTLFQLYEESVVSVIPSLCYDNLPNSALESLSLGVPIIAPAHGCFPEFVTENENGLLFEPGNPVHLALKIYTLLTDKNISAMSQKSVEFIRVNHSPEVHYKLIMEIIKPLTHER